MVGLVAFLAMVFLADGAPTLPPKPQRQRQARGSGPGRSPPGSGTGPGGRSKTGTFPRAATRMASPHPECWWRWWRPRSSPAGRRSSRTRGGCCGLASPWWCSQSRPGRRLESWTTPSHGAAPQQPPPTHPQGPGMTAARTSQSPPGSGEPGMRHPALPPGTWKSASRLRRAARGTRCRWQRRSGLQAEGQEFIRVEHDQAAQLLVPSQGAGLARDALHHVAVGGDDMRHDGRTGSGPAGASGSSSPPSRRAARRHSDGRSQALAEWPGGDLDAAGVSVFRVPWESWSPEVRSASRSPISSPYPDRNNWM